MIPDEDLHRHAVENLVQADALLLGRVTYEMMEAAWRRPARRSAAQAAVGQGTVHGRCDAPAGVGGTRFDR